jgi:hypothetical protein
MAQLTGAAAMTRRPATLRWLLLTCFLLVALAGFKSVKAETVDQPNPVDRPNPVEQQVKAAYLYKFSAYVEWPEKSFPSPDSPLRIGIVGADALADELGKIAIGRTVNGRPVIVRKLRREDSLAGLNVLFIGSSNNKRLPEILAAVKGQPILIVTESDDALAVGGMINFVVIDGKVRFEIAPKTAGLSQLSISARLLAAAYKVTGAS